MSASLPSDTGEEKRRLRAVLLGRRRALTAAQLAAASAEVARRLVDLPELAAPGALALFQPLAGELDLRGIATSRPLVFPRVVRGSRVLAFGPALSEAELAPGPLGLREPLPAADVPLGSIGTLIVPALAYDPTGLRLGRGAGYYDATLAAVPLAARIGVCLDDEVLPALPEEPHDERVDAIVTPQRILRAARSLSP